MQPTSSKAEPRALGDQLLEFCAGADRSLLLVAPFCKTEVVRRLLAACSNNVRIDLVTRWRALELAQGVSDLEVFDIVQTRPGTRMRLLQSLHAKVFVADEDRAYVGSANLTGAALGWSTNPNIELLVDVDPRLEPIQRFLAVCKGEAQDVDEQLRIAVAEQVAVLKEALPSVVAGREGAARAQLESAVAARHDWWPELRHPQDLYRVYAGITENLGSATVAAAKSDLQSLGIEMPGLTRTAFEAAVAGELVTAPVVRAVEPLLAERHRFGYVTKWIEDTWHVDRTIAQRRWQALQRWLLHFTPHRYGRIRSQYSEIVERFH